MDLGRIINSVHPPQFEENLSSMFDVKPMSGALGAEVVGVNLKTVSEEQAKEIERLLVNHMVVVFRDQHLEASDLSRFGKMLGEPEPHQFWEGSEDYPEVFELYSEGKKAVHYGSNWHTDLTCSEQPPKLSILCGVKIPPTGGDTLFCNLHLAFESLSETYKKMIIDLNGIHKSGFQVDTKSGFNEEGAGDKLKTQTTVTHPLICQHEVTKKNLLLANRIFTKGIEGLSKQESQGILDYLIAHSNRPEFTCRVNWKPGTVTIWDNRATAHYALGDFLGHERLMRRITIKGNKPQRGKLG
ncbi:MAG: TauD/TfdA family dioxygenase [Bdellovibrionales bacterium]|nr:TauD/TfdA family dioxygenase [Bdellovibrionales bacterium]